MSKKREDATNTKELKQMIKEIIEEIKKTIMKNNFIVDLRDIHSLTVVGISVFKFVPILKRMCYMRIERENKTLVS